MPSATIDIPPWTPPKPTESQDIDWAPLHTLDLSQITGDEFTEVPAEVVRQVGEAFRRDGFIYAVNHGLTWEHVLRQFAVGQYVFNGVSEEDKQKYKADILGSGSFVGYKEQGHWRINGVKDRIEQLNFGSQSFSASARQKIFPPSIQALIPEILAFARYNHGVILRKVLSVLSLVLKLPADALWKLSENPEEKGLDILRYAMYHTPPEEDDKALGGVRLQGHTDFNSVSILWSQPITSLEVLMPDNQWRLVKHVDNALVLDAGDALGFLSAGLIKPTIHRVVAPPRDQAHYTRLGIFYFALFNDEVPLEALLESPAVREAYEKKGEDPWKEVKALAGAVPTAGEWERLRTKAYGQMGAKKGEDGHEHEKIAGQKVTLYNDVARKQREELNAADGRA